MTIDSVKYINECMKGEAMQDIYLYRERIEEIKQVVEELGVSL